jgi:hypothetical protein
MRRQPGTARDETAGRVAAIPGGTASTAPARSSGLAPQAAVLTSLRRTESYLQDNRYCRMPECPFGAFHSPQDRLQDSCLAGVAAQDMREHEPGGSGRVLLVWSGLGTVDLFHLV